MGAAGPWFEEDICRLLMSLEHPKVSAGWTALLVVGALSGAVPWIGSNGEVDHAVVRLHARGDPSPVALLRLGAGECFAQRAVGFAGAGEEEHAGGGLVEAVYGPNVASGTKSLEPRLDAVGAPRGASRDGQEAGGLVDGNDVVVFVQDGDRRLRGVHPAQEMSEERGALLAAGGVEVPVDAPTRRRRGATPDLGDSDGLNTAQGGLLEQLRSAALSGSGGNSRGEEACQGGVASGEVHQAVGGVHVGLELPGQVSTRAPEPRALLPRDGRASFDRSESGRSLASKLAELDAFALRLDLERAGFGFRHARRAAVGPRGSGRAARAGTQCDLLVEGLRRRVPVVLCGGCLGLGATDLVTEPLELGERPGFGGFRQTCRSGGPNEALGEWSSVEPAGERVELHDLSARSSSTEDSEHLPFLLEARIVGMPLEKRARHRLRRLVGRQDVKLAADGAMPAVGRTRGIHRNAHRHHSSERRPARVVRKIHLL